MVLHSDAVSGHPQGDASVEPVIKAIRRIMHAVDRRSKKVGKATGLTIPQIVVLRALDVFGELATNRLSAHVDLTPATVITILDRLEEKNLIDRKRSTGDRRVVFTRLTEKGTRIARSAPPLLNDAFAAAFQRMSDRKRREVISTLGEVARLFEFPDEPGEFPPERSGQPNA